MANAKKLLIHTHLGLGDHFICCGVVRKTILRNEYEEYVVACYKHNYESVVLLFNDLKNTTVKIVESDREVEGMSHEPEYDYFRVCHWHVPGKGFDYSFYSMPGGYCIEDKRDYFKINRDFEKEKQLIEKLCPQEDFIFVQDTSSVGDFNLNIPPHNFKVVKPDPSLGFAAAHYLGVLEKAKQIHVLHSSFISLIDLALIRDELYYHRIKKSPYPDPTLFQNWKLIDY